MFGPEPRDCEHALRYVKAAAPELPVWLFCTRTPEPDVAAQFDQVVVDPRPLRLSVRAWTKLWRRWVALSVVTWTGCGVSALKAAPFSVPPFRVLVMNEQRDFFGAGPVTVSRHLRRRLLSFLMARWLSRPAWLWFRAFHGAEPLPIASASPSGFGVTRFDYTGEQVDWKELKRIAMASDARFVLLAKDGRREELDDMLPLFADPSTFAVARQSGLRPWTERVFQRAPFRKLQRGEACQVLAPISDAMLVDRARLLALGIPEAAYAGAGWMLLFWKAAAAGLRSYSVGGDRDLAPVPDWPVQYAEFVMRVTSQPGLFRLGPREPDLSAGNISRSIPGPRPLRDLPRVLVVSPYLPYPLSHGGAVRIYNLCRALAGQVDFLLATFRETADFVDYPKLHEIFREVYVVDRDEAKSRRPDWPRQVREHRSRAMRALIAKLCREKDIDALQIEYTHMAAFRSAARETPAILVEHDLTFTLYRQLAESRPSRAARREHRRWLDFERRAFRNFDAVWTMSDADRAAAIAEGSGPERTQVVPNGVDLGRFTPQPEAGVRPEILYVGSFRHLPNVIGFEKLLKEVMPRVWDRCPEARMRVVAGPAPDKYWRGSVDSRVEIDGFVEDLRPLYARARIAVVPLLVSAGTNIKVMEALACGRPVVTTPVGCAGLGLEDGRDALIRDTWPDFACAVARLLEDESLRASVAAQGRRTAEERFGWEAIAERAFECYTNLAAPESLTRLLA